MKKYELKTNLVIKKPELIDEDDINYIREIFWSNQTILKQNSEEYAIADKQYNEIREKLEELPKPYLELFEAYWTALNTINDYDLALMYTVGLEKGKLIANTLK